MAGSNVERIDLQMPGTPPADVQYFREYGIHSVPDDAGDIHIFSFPDWAELSVALDHDMPESGTVVTPELATFSGPHDQLVWHARQIDERIDSVIERSRGTDAEIWLGTPIVPSEWDDWRNSVLTIADGDIVGRTDKIFLSEYEHQHSPMKAAPRDSERYVNPLGQSALICADMILSLAKGLNNDPWPGETLLVPTCWAAVPDNPEMNEMRATWIERAGGVDNYFKNALVQGVSSVFRASQAGVVVVADRVVQGSGTDGPYNAVFRRV